jgi:alkylhydroperoxidase/carboxymuconolactone decarboxylase family protein YurZ
MASTELVAEEQASGRVGELYADIRETLGTDFVPNMYRAMAVNPAYLEANWYKVKTVMKARGKLDPLTKEIIAVAVSAVSGCAY